MDGRRTTDTDIEGSQKLTEHFVLRWAKKLQIAEVCAEQSPATLWIAVETLWRHCDRLELHVASFILNMLKTNAAALQSVLDSSLWGLLERH